MAKYRINSTQKLVYNNDLDFHNFLVILKQKQQIEKYILCSTDW